MPPPPAARAKVLSAYAEILTEAGERAATLDAVAKRAGVSKGGLLYHFGSKTELADGLVEYLDELVADDAVAMRDDPAGPVDYLLRTSHHLDAKFELIYQAAARLAMGANERAKASIEASYARWLQVLLDADVDPTVAATILLIADGLSLRSAAFGADRANSLAGVDVEQIIALAGEIDRGRRPAEAN